MVLIRKRSLLPSTGGDGELLGSLLRKVLGEKLAWCTLTLAIDPIHFTSPVMTYLNTLPHLRQVVLVRSALDFQKVVWGGALCRVYLFLLHQAQPLLSFADKDFRHWDYYAK
ncbi:hypothetical protein Pmani_015794 [Petrolisthes manimaculis]|uniref:Uncharacterized protein n=1 Tax=Petrolisthes manimaculis TaxID=1843537 RepID=A0AAE1PQA1_9EUCA|nr:hypothetical protein Pmani_015794 [Petrolisthes manimaculis]